MKSPKMLFTFVDIPQSDWFYVSILTIQTNGDSILKLTSLALSLWPNCLEKKPNRIANENKRITLKTFAKDYGAKKDVFILFFLFAQIPSGYSKCNKSIRTFFLQWPSFKKRLSCCKFLPESLCKMILWD